MKKILTDLHTHTAFSPDGRGTMEEMLSVAHALGVGYYGLSEHFNFDMVVNHIPLEGTKPQTPVAAYFQRARELQKEYEGKMHVLVGGEFGYTDNLEAQKMYQELVDKYHPDYVIQSVHNLAEGDYAYGHGYTDSNGKVRDKQEVYEEYLGLVRRSLDVSHPYDILGHVSYCTRYAPYEDRRMLWKDFSASLDDILRTVIAKDKILEVNSSNKQGPALTLPDNDILERYFELGGRKISFGSDAHFPSRIMEHRERVMDVLRSIGFEYVSVPCCGEVLKIEI
ncbi:MAG: histidinol-phosphatase HisJ family protein [Clostridiales bacterium]|nr:histidinol-phosphatase HisJ family protein [Clostridiales bacterium]